MLHQELAHEAALVADRHRAVLARLEQQLRVAHSTGRHDHRLAGSAASAAAESPAGDRRRSTLVTCERLALASNPTTDRPSATSTPPRPSSATRYFVPNRVGGVRSGTGRYDEARQERLLEVDVFGIAVEDFGRGVPVRHERRPGNRPAHADGGVVEVDVAMRHAPAGPERGRAAKGAVPMPVPGTRPRSGRSRSSSTAPLRGWSASPDSKTSTRLRAFASASASEMPAGPDPTMTQS